MHGDGQGSHDRFRFGERHRAGSRYFLLQPADRVGLFSEREADRRGRQRLGREAALALEAHGAESNARAPHVPGFARIDRGEGQAAQDLLQKSQEFVAPPAIVELEALHSRLRQAPAPIPVLELAQRVAAVDDFVAQEGEQRARRIDLEIMQLLIGEIDGALPRGVTVAIQRHCGERLRERVEETRRIAHRRALRVTGAPALRTSGSLDAAAMASTAPARASVTQPLARAISAAINSRERAGSFGRPRQFVPPFVSPNSAINAVGLVARPRTLMASTRSSEAASGSRAIPAIPGSADSGQFSNAALRASRAVRGSESRNAPSSARSRSSGSFSISLSASRRTRGSSCAANGAAEKPSGSAPPGSASRTTSRLRTTYHGAGAGRRARTRAPNAPGARASRSRSPRRVVRDSDAASASSNGSNEIGGMRGRMRSSVAKSGGSGAVMRCTRAGSVTRSQSGRTSPATAGGACSSTSTSVPMRFSSIRRANARHTPGPMTPTSSPVWSKRSGSAS